MASFIDECPNELIGVVFSYFGPNTLDPVSRVCSRWNKISNDDGIWEPIFQKHFSRYQNDPRLEKNKDWKTICKQCVQLKKADRAKEEISLKAFLLHCHV